MESYIFIRVVGKGSYGEVDLVKHKTDRKQVFFFGYFFQYVIKKLNLTTSSKRERRAAEQEAQLLSQLRHPNIVTYRESWEGNDRQLYIVMGFCEGGDLYHRLKQQKGELLQEKQVVEWFVQIAMALQYLHERNILHRDLKTQNIFLTKTNIIKVGDLGIARVLENQNDMASTLIGTPYYMSPELFSNKPYNHKSDVWALGCCVYEMSTLKHAFNAKDMNSLVYRIVEGKLPQMPSRYDTQLGDLIKSMLCKRPEDRPDVKIILRQPYIKRQIAMFLEATKEKTAKSRKKAVGGSGDCKTKSVSSEALSQPKPERPPPSPQQEPLDRVKWTEEKSQQHKSWTGLTDCAPVETPPPPKPPSPDVLNASIVSMATVSNIDVDIPLQKGDSVMQRQEQRPQFVMSHHDLTNESETDRVHKDSKGKGKPDPSPPPSPGKLPLKAVSGVVTRGGHVNTQSNGLLDLQQQALPNPGDTFYVETERNEKQMPHVDCKDDTMELLIEADMQNQDRKNLCEVNMNNKNDIVKRSSAQHPHTLDIQDNLEATEKLLEPPVLDPVQEDSSSLDTRRGQATPFQSACYFSEPSVSHRGKVMRQTQGDHNKFNVAPPRPLPQPPAQSVTVERKKRSSKTTESKKAGVTAVSTSISSSKDGFLPLPQDRPLSARERRRLRQSQESSNHSEVNAVRRASYDVVSTKADACHIPVTHSASYCVTETHSKLMEPRSDEEDCASSTSSTERSEGDCRSIRKTESSDMHDLVNMMTQTLRGFPDSGHEVDKGRTDSNPQPEFKLNRQYRDTLVLHGKAREDAKNLSLGEIPKGFTSGPAKMRRAIEHLRTDVVKGLGIKLLDKVLEILDEEDEAKRELHLRDQMGDDKYQAYAVMVRQLKFFEDIALNV
ncbi:serine/threonine-protein kinase Nek4 isoform X2 [Cololabis saira]|uniref:serine/threonine-protein kinase Nek4 isoform X2 n=1 Tax=Cololabis saira TaxID=129043 RepID=UPI002AD471B5|nr:serine/threonine-protein kinase Nek4 isoform X2 [Cololabis saira]